MQRTLHRHGLYALMTALFISLCSLAHAAGTLPESGPLLSQPAQALIASQGDKLAIVDVRTQQEYDTNHIRGAKLIPVEVLEQNLDKLPDGPVLIVCRTGRRAGIAYDIIMKAQPERQHLWYLKGTPVYHPDGTGEFH